MSKKKPTKAQIEATEKAALRQRLKDIALGAYGPFIDPPDFDNTECCLSCRMGSDAFYRWIGGICNALLKGDADDFRIRLHCLHEYDSLDGATNFLYTHGVRA